MFGSPHTTFGLTVIKFELILPNLLCFLNEGNVNMRRKRPQNVELVFVELQQEHDQYE